MSIRPSAAFETTASAAAAAEAWMTAQPLADRDSTAALVLDRAEARLRVVAPEQMAAYDQLRSEGGRAPFEAMRAVAPNVQHAAPRPLDHDDPAGGPAPASPRSPEVHEAPRPGSLGSWTSLNSETGASAGAGIPDLTFQPPSRELGR